MAAATLSLLAAAAEERPVLAVVDDAHWLDTPSREALLFAGRRLGSEGVLLLLAMRDREWISSAGLDTLLLHGLSPRDAAALVENTGAPVDAALSNRLVAETRGNPLAILEAVATLTEAERLGRRPIGHPASRGCLPGADVRASARRPSARHSERAADCRGERHRVFGRDRAGARSGRA